MHILFQISTLFLTNCLKMSFQSCFYMNEIEESHFIHMFCWFSKSTCSNDKIMIISSFYSINEKRKNKHFKCKASLKLNAFSSACSNETPSVLMLLIHRSTSPCSPPLHTHTHTHTHTHSSAVGTYSTELNLHLQIAAAVSCLRCISNSPFPSHTRISKLSYSFVHTGWINPCVNTSLLGT